MSGALDPAIQQEIIDRDLYATAVLSGNRNFDGRIHPYAKQAFLASPPLVVAYAIAGTIRFDIEKAALGAAVVIILAMLAKTKNYYISGSVFYCFNGRATASTNATLR